jgi:hypothetical protein
MEREVLSAEFAGKTEREVLSFELGPSSPVYTLNSELGEAVDSEPRTQNSELS